MLKQKVEIALNNQVKEEFESSQIYLAMASWAESNGFGGAANFFYAHSEEERMHGMKMIHYINDRGGNAIISELPKPEFKYNNVQEIFESAFQHEQYISEKINELVGICRNESDYSTENFMQWYVQEQVEEESLFSDLLDKLELLGDHKGKMFLFDNELAKASAAHSAE